MADKQSNVPRGRESGTPRPRRFRTYLDLILNSHEGGRTGPFAKAAENVAADLVSFLRPRWLVLLLYVVSIRRRQCSVAESGILTLACFGLVDKAFLCYSLKYQPSGSNSVGRMPASTV